jgi:2-C-methyl-D-erythritol 4-phosphate cytidylyltransferase
MREERGGDVLPPAVAILPAAGAGARMGGVPKQLRPLGDAPVLVQSARAVLRHPAVRALVVAAPPAEVEAVRTLLAAFGVGEGCAVAVVAGGATRQASVAAALAAAPEGVTLALVHDAARPFLPGERLAAVLAAAATHGAAALAVPVADTLRRAEGDAFGETVPRGGLWRMQTPQAARVDLLRRALDAAARDGFEGTDEVALLRRIGVAVRLVEGDARNVKLTEPSDWALAEALWENWAKSGESGRSG